MSCTGHRAMRTLRRYVAVAESAKEQEVRNAWNL